MPMLARSAAPMKQKIQTMTNEFLRRMVNTSRDLPMRILDNVLAQYARDLARERFLPSNYKGYFKLSCQRIPKTDPPTNCRGKAY